MSKPSKYGERHIRFCPKCGMERLRRDWFLGAPGIFGKKQPKVGAEFVCDSCGFAFWVSKSRRVLCAESLQKEARSRAPVKFTAACVGEEITNLYLRSVDPPVIGMLKERIVNKLKGLIGKNGKQKESTNQSAASAESKSQTPQPSCSSKSQPTEAKRTEDSR